MEAPTPEARRIPEPPGVQDHQVQQLGLLLKYETETTLLFDTVQISTVRVIWHQVFYVNPCIIQ